MDEIKPIDDITADLNINFYDDKKESEKQIVKEEDVNKTKEIINKVHEQATIDIVKNDKEVQQQILDKAKRSIDTELDTLDQVEKERNQKATYNANKEACEIFGIDKDVATWKVKLMRFGDNVWFIVYYIVAFITIAPINRFAKGIKAFIKHSWLAILVAVLIWALIFVGVPIITAWLIKMGYKAE